MNIFEEFRKRNQFDSVVAESEEVPEVAPVTPPAPPVPELDPRNLFNPYGSPAYAAAPTPGYPAPVPGGLFVPAPAFDEKLLKKMAEFDAAIIIGRTRGMFGVLKNVIAEMTVSPRHQAALDAYALGGELTPAVLEAQKRQERKEKLLAQQPDELEDTQGILRDIILIDLTERARRGRYRMPSPMEFQMKMFGSLAVRLLESNADAITDFGRAAVQKIFQASK